MCVQIQMIRVAYKLPTDLWILHVSAISMSFLYTLSLSYFFDESFVSGAN